jgi:hypothetical protein
MIRKDFFSVRFQEIQFMISESLFNKIGIVDEDMDIPDAEIMLVDSQNNMGNGNGNRNCNCSG